MKKINTTTTCYRSIVSVYDGRDTFHPILDNTLYDIGDANQKITRTNAYQILASYLYSLNCTDDDLFEINVLRLDSDGDNGYQYFNVNGSRDYALMAVELELDLLSLIQATNNPIISLENVKNTTKKSSKKGQFIGFAYPNRHC